MPKTKKTIWRPDQKITQDIATANGAMSVTFDPEGSAKILQINLHLSAISSTEEDLTINLDSNNGSEYDINILTQDMKNIKDLILTKSFFDEYIVFEGDKLIFTWANTDSLTWGLEVIYRRYDS